jgi:hypothetical protein
MTPITLGVALLASAATKSELTVYNDGFALVKEQRTLPLKQGVHEVTVEDVAQQIEANSVSVRSLNDAGAFTVLEQAYRFDLVSVQAILAKAVGGRIHFNQVMANGEIRRVSGTLMSAPNAIVSDANGNQTQVYNGMVVRTDDGRILLNPTGTVEVDSIPEGMISKPSLVWLLDSAKTGDQPIEMSYLSRGFSWKSDYVLNLDQAGTTGDLKGWVTMTNNSGTAFKDAKLKLLAGEVNRAPVQRFAARGGAMMNMAKASAPQMAEEQFGDYHLYTLDRPATVNNNEIKQLSLTEASGVKVTKMLLIDAMADYGTWYPQEGAVGVGNIKPVVYIQLANTKENQMGMPLPAGTFKVVQRSKSGSLEMLGEDAITHTPRNETIKLKVGKAFDVVADRKRLTYTRLSDRAFRETFEIEVRNRKETPETVTVWERHWGDHKVTNSNAESKWLDSNTLQFVLTMAPNEVKKVTYTIETRW